MSFDNIQKFYQSVEERTRLQEGAGVIEKLRTQAKLKERLPASPAVILDIGGGPGIYALSLAKQGYTVHLIDAIEKHIREAQENEQNFQPQYPLASCVVGDARDLSSSFPENTLADAVLMFGPLYHLAKEDRAKALKEAHRLLKPNGLLFAVGISRFATLMDGIARNLIADPAFVQILQRDLRTGEHVNDTENPEYFTTAMLTRPSELAQEIRDAAFAVEEVIGIEGPAWALGGQYLNEFLKDDKRLNIILETAKIIEHEPSIVGASAHFMVIAKREEVPTH